MKLITVLTPCFNEAANVSIVQERIAAVMNDLGRKLGSTSAREIPGGTELNAEISRVTSEELVYDYAHIFIDNASTDETQKELRKLAANDPRVKVIINQRNFGHVRSPFYGLLHSPGDAVIVIAADLQDPPELIPEFVKKWREGFLIAVGQKVNSKEPPLLFALRRFYYRLTRRLADVNLLENVTGFGLYDRKVIEAFRALDDPYPYVRGLIAELGYPVARIPYEQPKRVRGISKNNLYTLYDIAMLGITSHSKVPLRLATMLGFAASVVSFVVALIYLIYKLVYWDRFALGVAPIVIGLFFFASVQLFFIGIIGEYIGAIHTRVSKRPLVVEKERINF